jgi:hypothetical protein
MIAICGFKFPALVELFYTGNVAHASKLHDILLRQRTRGEHVLEFDMIVIAQLWRCGRRLPIWHDGLRRIRGVWNRRVRLNMGHHGGGAGSMFKIALSKMNYKVWLEIIHIVEVRVKDKM